MDSGLAPYSYCIESFALSPCGRGLNGVATIAMGEGASSQKELLAKRTPHPFSDVAPPSCPLPQGRGQKLRALVCGTPLSYPANSLPYASENIFDAARLA